MGRHWQHLRLNFFNAKKPGGWRIVATAAELETNFTFEDLSEGDESGDESDEESDDGMAMMRVVRATTTMSEICDVREHGACLQRSRNRRFLVFLPVYHGAFLKKYMALFLCASW